MMGEPTFLCRSWFKIIRQRLLHHFLPSLSPSFVKGERKKKKAVCQQINRSNTITHTENPQFEGGEGGGSLEAAVKALKLAFEFIIISFSNRRQVKLQ